MQADDAKARVFKVCYDTRTHSCERLKFPRTKEFFSSALLAMNDAKFKKKDWVSIQSVGNSEKRQDWGKTGRFGVGFNSVYHMTDLPSIVSGTKYAIFDPHRKFLRKKGWIVDFVKKQSVVSQFPDQFRPLEALGCDMKNPFDGTLFRFPLRTKLQAMESSLSTIEYNDTKIQELFHELRAGLRFTRTQLCTDSCKYQASVLLYDL